MTIVDFLSHLRDLDVKVWSEDGQLCYSAPEGTVTPELRSELALRKAEILSFLREASASVGIRSESIPVMSRSEPLPLSFAQERLWVLEQFSPGNPVYNIPVALELLGPLEKPVLERSLNEIVRRHEILRTTFMVVNGQPRQVIASHLTIPLAVIDLCEYPERDREAAVRRLAFEEATNAFDLSRGPLLRATLLETATDVHILLLTMHHIISDGWSLAVFMRELTTIYENRTMEEIEGLPKLPVQFGDFAQWQRQQLQGVALAQSLLYWKQQLDGIPQLLSLPTDRPRPSFQAYRGASQSITLPKNIYAAVTELSRLEDVTIFMVLLAAFQVLLSRYSGQTDIVVGTPVANRHRREFEDLIGFFANTLALRIRLDHTCGFRELLRLVREMTLEAYEHQDVPIEKIVEELNPQREASHSPVFQVMFVFQNTPLPRLEIPGLALRVLDFGNRTSKFDLTLTLSETDGALNGSFEYNTDLFDGATINRMSRHFQILLQSAVAEPDRPIAEISFLTSDELALLEEWNNTGEVLDSANPCLHKLFEAQVARTPEHVAVIAHQESLSYAELDQRAGQVAHRLRQLRVGPENRVGICMDRSPELIIGLLAILKTGAAYVPLDPVYPPERIAFLLHDAEAPLVLTQQRLGSIFPVKDTALVFIEDLLADDEVAADSTHIEVLPDNLAYVIYTSGTTGNPKGVCITHGSASALIKWAHTVFSPTELERVLASTSICFDLSVFELFAPLACGGTVVLVNNILDITNPEYETPISLINTVPSALNEVLRLRGGLPSTVCTVNLAGEPFPITLARELYAQDTVERVLNLYGPSEDTTYSTFAIIDRDAETVAIGRPVTGSRVYLLDARLAPVPIGITGELYIGGVGLARGYLFRPELTAERFIPDPFSKRQGERIYRTGDLARYLPDGSLVFLGRIDRQLKIRGFRIEPGEIETVLRRHPQVREAVIQARASGTGNMLLTAYLVPVEEQAVTSAGLRQYLQDKLPDYMIPSAFVMLDTLPLLPNGKLNLDALAESSERVIESGQAYTAPVTAVEEKLASIWCDILNVTRVGTHDDFFARGGHSLLVTQLVMSIRNTFHVDLQVRSVFENPTIFRLAPLIEEAIAREDITGLLEKLEGLSDEEVIRRLAASE